jgi:CXXX repeat peptide maturase
MIKYLLVVLAPSSVAYCHYRSVPQSNGRHGLISVPNLRKTVIFALKNNLKINYLYPDFPLPATHKKLIEEADHIKIIPPSQAVSYPDAIVVLNAGDAGFLQTAAAIDQSNIILQVAAAQLPALEAHIRRLMPRHQRINLVLNDIEKYDEKELAEYRIQLGRIAKRFATQAAKYPDRQLNFLTDRLALAQMNNCNAGLTHLTVAPNGKLYLCPAFYHHDAKDTLGEIVNDPRIVNRQLLEVKYAPVCRVCDAFHCRRCVWLNRKLTGEINTPSYQQCISVHLERDASRKLRGMLAGKGFDTARLSEIPELSYLDPFEEAKQGRMQITTFKEL